MGSGRYLNFNKNHRAIQRAITYFLIPPPLVPVNKSQRHRHFLQLPSLQLRFCSNFFCKESNTDVTNNILTVAVAKIEFGKQWDDAEIYYTSIQGVGGHVTHLGLLRTSGISMHVVLKQACYPFFPCLCHTVKQFPGQSKANNSQNGSCIQVDVWGAFMVHMFEVCWETWSSNYISVRVHCLVGTVKVKVKYGSKIISAWKWSTVIYIFF